jgi:diguanylate cyclase (GGDEF)-like protein
MTAARRVAELESVLRAALAENHQLSAIDDLTRVGSKRFFSKEFSREAERAGRYGQALSLILCDIDHFKTVNDTLGHAGGDDVLRHFGSRLQQLADYDGNWIARVGGEEFAVVLPGAGMLEAGELAEKLRQGVASEPFDVEGTSLAVTASFGLCAVEQVPPEQHQFSDHVLKAADAALYRSKHSGRNRVTTASLPGMTRYAACASF